MVIDEETRSAVSRYKFKEVPSKPKRAVNQLNSLPSCTKYKKSNRTCPYFNLVRAKWTEIWVIPVFRSIWQPQIKTQPKYCNILGFTYHELCNQSFHQCKKYAKSTLCKRIPVLNSTGKVGCAILKVISSEFRMRQYRDDDHREDASNFRL